MQHALCGIGHNLLLAELYCTYYCNKTSLGLVSSFVWCVYKHETAPLSASHCHLAVKYMQHTLAAMHSQVTCGDGSPLFRPVWPRLLSLRSSSLRLHCRPSPDRGIGMGKNYLSAWAKTNCNMGKLHQLRIQGARILEESCIYTCMDPYHHDEWVMILITYVFRMCSPQSSLNASWLIT